MPVQIEGTTFCSNEQYFQRAKALFFGDNDCANLIMDETDPFKIQALGKKVKGYKKEIWEKNARRVLKHVNTAKFSQNKDAKQALSNTGNKRLGEASPDLFYGIGVHVTSPLATNETNWEGENLMGQILTEIRDM